MATTTYFETEDGYRFVLNEDGSYHDLHGDMAGDSLDEFGDTPLTFIVADEVLPDDISERDGFAFVASHRNGFDDWARGLYFVTRYGDAYDISPITWGGDTVGALFKYTPERDGDDPDAEAHEGSIYRGRYYVGDVPTLADFARVIHDGAC